MLSFSVSFRLSEKVIGGIFFFSFGVNLLISGIEFWRFKSLSVSGEPLRFFSGKYWPKLSGMSSDSPKSLSLPSRSNEMFAISNVKSSQN